MNLTTSSQDIHSDPPPLRLRDITHHFSERLTLLSSVFLLTIATDWLTFGIPLGAGVTLLCGVLWFALRLNRPSRKCDWKDLLLFILMGASAIQAGIESSFSNWLILFLLTIYASGHFLHRQITPYWRRALEGLFGIFDIYRGFLNCNHGLQEARNSTQEPTFKVIISQSRRWLIILAPAATITLTFLLLFSSGNAIMGDEVKGILERSLQWISDYQFPTFFRIVFWICASLLLMSLLSKSPLSLHLVRLEQRLPKGWAVPTDLSASIWSSRILLLAVNVIFFAANSLDVFYLWMDIKLPDEVNYSEYVHRGVYNLIACVALAAGVLLIVFQQNKQVIKAKGQKLLAYIWITQNFLLVSSVILRLRLYVDTYHLSLLRLYVAFFLLLVVVGFILLAFKINQERKFSWLVNSNLLAVFILFFLVQFINDRAFVARYNYERALGSKKGIVTLDVAYLADLGPAAWPVLKLVANDRSQFGAISNLAKDELLYASHDEQNRIKGSDWRSWQYRRWIARHSLPGFDHKADFQANYSTQHH